TRRWAHRAPERGLHRAPGQARRSCRVTLRRGGNLHLKSFSAHRAPLHCAPLAARARMTTEPPAPKDTRLAALRSALEQGSMRHAQRMINSLSPGEIASLIESLPPAKREIVWEFVAPELEGDVLIELNEDVRSGL